MQKKKKKRMDHQQKNYKTERPRGLGRRIKEDLGKEKSIASPELCIIVRVFNKVVHMLPSLTLAYKEGHN